jgi:hypothetical protein
VMNAVREYGAQRPQRDDRTILAIKIGPQFLEA